MPGGCSPMRRPAGVHNLAPCDCIKGRERGDHRASQKGFSLAEIVLAIGLVALVLVSLLGLLPLGSKLNQASAEETRALNILTCLEADLRNARSANSRFGLPLPYVVDAAGKTTFNPLLFSPPLSTGALSTKGLQEDETPVTGTSVSGHYQVSVIYTTIPAPGSLLPVEARLIVNWPPLNTTAVQDLVSKSLGHVESFVTFPAP